jgi:hypothetical protein
MSTGLTECLDFIVEQTPSQASATMYRAERLEGVSRCPIPSKPPSSRNHNNPKRTPGPTHTGRNTTFLEEYANSPALLSGSVNKPEVAQLQSPGCTGGTTGPAQRFHIAVVGHLFQTFTHLPGLIRLAISGPLSPYTPHLESGL